MTIDLTSYFLEEKDKIQFLGNNMCSCIVTLKVFCVSCVANYIQRTLKDQTMCQEALFFFLYSREYMGQRIAKYH